MTEEEQDENLKKSNSLPDDSEALAFPPKSDIVSQTGAPGPSN